MYSVTLHLLCMTSDLCLTSRRRYTGGKTVQTTGNIKQLYYIIYHVTSAHIVTVCVQRCGSDVSMAAGAETAFKQKEAWPENNSPRLSTSGPSPDHRPAASPPSKPIRMKPPSPVAPPPVVPPPHGIHGTLRHADFQHNGERQRCARSS